MQPDTGSAFGLASITSAEVRAALEKILTSDEFVASPQLCAFLSYIVEAHLAGNEHLLKGQTIGTVVLGRPEGYDSQRDPIVRVEANRLRRTLVAYYENSGAEAPVRVFVERGSYVPHFGRLVLAPSSPAPSALEPAAMSEPGAVQPVSRRPWPMVAVIGLALTAFAIGLLLAFRPPAPAPGDLPVEVGGVASVKAGILPVSKATSPYLPSVEVFPFDVVGSGQMADRSDDLESSLTVALARFPELRVLAQEGQPADFRIEGDIEVADLKSSVAIRLLSTRSAEVLWSGSLDMPVAELMSRAGTDRVVALATTAIAPQFGAIAQYVSHRDDRAADMQGYDCLIDAQLQLHRIDDGSWERIDSCLRDMIEQHPTFATAWASRALLRMEGYRLEPDTPTARASLKAADELARRALELEPTNVRAMTAVAAVAFGKDDLEAARNIGLRAITANPYDPLARLQYVLALVASDYPDQALQQSEAARRLDPAHISFYDSLEFLARVGKPTGAVPVSGAVMADASLLPYGAIARVLAYDATGETAAREDAVKALYALMPLFSSDLPAALRRQFPPSPYTDRLEEALRKAGVGI
jgi:adenylate cyclase